MANIKNPAKDRFDQIIEFELCSFNEYEQKILLKLSEFIKSGRAIVKAPSDNECNKVYRARRSGKLIIAVCPHRGINDNFFETAQAVLGDVLGEDDDRAVFNGIHTQTIIPMNYVKSLG